MKLIVVRHGETEENAARVVQGHLPGHLNEKGKDQAKEIAQKLKDKHFDQAWSSDLQRSVDTAEYIMEFHPEIKLQLTPAIREVKYGDLQGKGIGEINWGAIEGASIDKQYPGGESYREMSERVYKFINGLLAEFPDQSILIVTHGGPMRLIKSAYEKIPLDNIQNRDIANTAIFDYEIKEPLKSV
jgi:broad specificity phosphatase PhoE